MSTLWLYAVTIDEVRGIFGADPLLADRLRATATRRFAEQAPATPGLLGKLGPAFRRHPGAPITRPNVPTAAEVDALLASRYLPPDRLGAAWVLLLAWLDELAPNGLALPMTGQQLADFDFDLACSGVSSRLGLTDLLKAGLGVPLAPGPGWSAGWVPAEHAAAIAPSWRPCVSELPPARRELADTILDWLEARPGWTQQPPWPDLVAVFQP
ncbi:hypothetical protein ATK74_2051 [Propionicimonas paludicola]|uniref:DUF7691 domain-containing protein n=1 Tax=Propionicimonas paludicola TaxID=185243 RepID=A0A2A9CV30_9ACTN|nr:hypothetical protein [Propionicimonas paludicola]PFG17480.1 hypothetical protein ATK74_2051 [Propionicimonas paludicola]